MARIIGGIAASHTPTIGFAYDRNKRDDPVWAPIFENFAPLAAWLEEKRPDVLLLIYNDHVTSFCFDHYRRSRWEWGPSGLSPMKAGVRAMCLRSRGIQSSPRTSATR
jgi:gallate dioxygenase